MRKVKRSDIVDYQTYNDQRDDFRASVLKDKELRRIHLGDHLTFLFETTDTIRYQIQEMMRLEHIVREKDIQHEIDTYNDLLGGPGELGCSLLIEIDDPGLRDKYLKQWLGLPKHLYVKTQDGRRVRASWDPAQVGTDRLSSVQYLKFELGRSTPIAVGVDHPKLNLESDLTAEQRDALSADLQSNA